MDVKGEKTVEGIPPISNAQNCLFAETNDSHLFVGVVSAAEPSSLALLAAGVAGLSARRARRERMSRNPRP